MWSKRSPHLKNFGFPIFNCFEKVATNRSNFKSGATNPSAPAPAHNHRFLQLVKQIADIRDMLEELRRLGYEMENINGRIDSLARQGETLDDLPVKVYRHKAEIIELRKQDEKGSAPSSPLIQLAGKDRFPIPIYSEESSTLSKFLKLFYT